MCCSSPAAVVMQGEAAIRKFCALCCRCCWQIYRRWCVFFFPFIYIRMMGWNECGFASCCIWFFWLRWHSTHTRARIYTKKLRQPVSHIRFICTDFFLHVIFYLIARGCMRLGLFHYFYCTRNIILIKLWRRARCCLWDHESGNKSGWMREQSEWYDYEVIAAERKKWVQQQPNRNKKKLLQENLSRKTNSNTLWNQRLILLIYVTYIFVVCSPTNEQFLINQSVWILNYFFVVDLFVSCCIHAHVSKLVRKGNAQHSTILLL